MKRQVLTLTVGTVAVVLAAGWSAAQYWRGSREYSDRYNVRGDWPEDPDFPEDVFTFVRIQYSSAGGYSRRSGRGYGRGGDWRTDYPDSDLNFSFRLQQLTSLKVNPEPKIMQLTDPQLCDYPFIYIVEPGRLLFSEDEIEALRRYLYNGGFLMVDDFWGDDQWENFYQEIKRVFPEREPLDLPLEHEVFHCVYDLKERPQIPSIGAAMEGRSGGVTWEWGHSGNTRDVHYRGIFDDDGRMMAIICHNTDLGDGWEREGEDPWYFREFAEKKAYPLGINIVVYAMTH